MKSPRKNKQWAAEAYESLEQAWKLAAAEKEGTLTEEDKEHLYKYAPLFCARNRGIRDKSRLKRIAHFTYSRRLSDIQHYPERIEHYAYNFLAAYLDAHIATEHLTEARAGEIMRHLLRHYSL